MLQNDQFIADRASLGGVARKKKLSREERSAIAKSGAKSRWQNIKKKQLEGEASIETSRGDGIPEARYRGMLNLVGTEIPVYNL